jgi:hypothetical protein
VPTRDINWPYVFSLPVFLDISSRYVLENSPLQASVSYLSSIKKRVWSSNDSTVIYNEK